MSGSLPPSSRFRCATSGLDLSRLRLRLRRLLWFSVGLAAAVHLIAVILNPFQQTLERTPRPLTTRFIKREPRLTKPLELRKRPEPRRQMMRHQVQLASARMDQVQAAAVFDARGLMGQVAAPSVSLARQVDFHSMELEPTMRAEAIVSTRQPDSKIDLALEMLDITSMDTGRYRAMVIQDPTDRQAIRGFLNMALVMSARSVSEGTIGYTDVGVTTVEMLVNTVAEYTGLNARFLGQITYDDNRLMEVPIIIPRGNPNQSEMQNLADYLLAGGFVLGWLPFNEILEKYAGLINGHDFWTERLTDDHPVFSSFFDIKGGGVLSGLHGAHLANQKDGVSSWLLINGFFIRGRLVGIGFSHGSGWLNHEYSSDGTRNLQLAVNVIVYALTQEGSITQRLMQMVN